MKMQTKMKGALGLSALIALAACGSSAAKVSPGAQPSAASSTTSTSAKPRTTTTTTIRVASSAPIVMTSSASKLGTLLVDGKGMTLYTLSSAGKPVPCTGQCATFWPPLLLPSGTMTAMGAPGVTDLGTASAAGGLQVTVNGAPVYRFSIDKSPGDTNGEGISSFGGTWHVVAAGGTTIATTPVTAAPIVRSPLTSPPTTAPVATTSTTYGYGYGS